MDSVRIFFELRPLGDIEPWGDAESGLKLHWFGLTDGWYDVVIGDHHLFSDAAGDARGIDYPVVRLWEDLIDVAPAAFEEIPAALAMRLAAADRWSDWIDRAWDLENAEDLWETAVSWWSERHVDTGYLRGAPGLHLWRCGHELHLRWRSPPRQPDEPDWSSPKGDAVTSVAAFKDELLSFDRTLIDAMRARVTAIATAWSRLDIVIDVDELRREHELRASWLARALTTKRPSGRSWDDVLSAVASLEDRIGGVVG